MNRKHFRIYGALTLAISICVVLAIGTGQLLFLLELAGWLALCAYWVYKRRQIFLHRPIRDPEDWIHQGLEVSQLKPRVARFAFRLFGRPAGYTACKLFPAYLFGSHPLQNRAAGLLPGKETARQWTK